MQIRQGVLRLRHSSSNERTPRVQLRSFLHGAIVGRSYQLVHIHPERGCDPGEPVERGGLLPVEDRVEVAAGGGGALGEGLDGEVASCAKLADSRRESESDLVGLHGSGAYRGRACVLSRGQKILDTTSSIEDKWVMETRREVALSDVLVALRLALGVPSVQPVPGEELANLGREVPEQVKVDPGAWIAWCVGGLVLLDGEGQPSRSSAIDEAKRMIAAMAMHRWGGNLTRAAKMLDTSRRALRDSLRHLQLYPWPGRKLSRVEHRRELARYRASRPADAAQDSRLESSVAKDSTGSHS